MPESRNDRAPRLRTRLGLALTSPRWALAIADDPGQPGRAGTDLVVLLLVAVVAIHTRGVVAAAWLAGAIDLGIGARALVDVIARAVTVPLAFVLVAAAVTWVAAGRRRALGRDFDLACVAVVPLVVVEVAATLAVRLAGAALPAPVGWVIAGVGYGWAASLVVLAIAQARRRQAAGAIAHLPDVARRRARPAGAAALALAGALLAAHAAWVVNHLDWLRPMASGDRVPAFALPRIEAGGALGAPVRSEELAGKVVVLDFWATWCGPCRDALPALSALATRRADDVVVVSVTLDDPATARAMFDAEGYRTLLVADAGDAADRFGVSSIPHLVVVDRDGVVRMVSRGEGNLGSVIARAEALAAE